MAKIVELKFFFVLQISLLKKTQCHRKRVQGVSTPIMDPEMQEREISSVRTIVVDDFACGACKIVAYSGKNLSGKCVEAVGGQVDFEFCVKSFTLKCNTDWVEEEEFEEEEEEEEEQQE